MRTLAVGQSLVLPWLVFVENGREDLTPNRNIDRAARRIAKQLGWRIATQGTPRGLRVTRLE